MHVTSLLPNADARSDLPQWSAIDNTAPISPVPIEGLPLIQAAGISLDISGQGSSPELDAAAQALLDARNFNDMRSCLLEGGIANVTEDRAAWHSALRAPAPIDEITAERQRLNEFVRLAD